MNIFEQYGIKEVADVTLYAIELDDNDDEIYIPVMYLDTLKVSTIEQTAQQTSARGGLGNPELIIWDYGKEITVSLEDALYTPASQSMKWSGNLAAEKFTFPGNFTGKIGEDKAEITVDAKVIVDKVINFRTYSPDDVSYFYNWECSLNIITDNGFMSKIPGYKTVSYNTLNKIWFVNGGNTIGVPALEGSFTIDAEKINSKAVQEFLFSVSTSLNDTHILERTEKCKAAEVFAIDANKNTIQNNYRLDNAYSNQELVVYLDPKTMLPYEGNATSFTKKDGSTIQGDFKVFKQYENYLRWSRTVSEDNESLGSQIIVDNAHFPGTYRLVGETYARSRDTGKDQRFQFEIPLCKMSSDNNITLQAAGDPTTFSMNLKVMRREDGVMLKLTQYDVEKEKFNGHISNSTKIVPQTEQFS